MRILEAATQLRSAPRMYLLDQRYNSYSAFLLGLTLGSEEDMTGFQSFAAKRLFGTSDCNVHWTALPCYSVRPDLQDVDRRLSEMTEADERIAAETLLDLIFEYYGDAAV